MFFQKRNLRRLLCYFIIFAMLASIYYIGNVHSWTWYSNRKNQPCVTPKEEMDDLMELAKDCHIILNKFNLTNILVYGSLWGAIRYNNPVPWDNDLDVALLSDEMQAVDQKAFYNEFAKKNIKIFYRIWFGTYRVTRNKARGDLMVFQRALFGQMSRTGIESWVCYINHRYYHMFSEELFERPLPTLKFAGVDYSVPRKGIEIQKRVYPNDWWKESKPIGC